jgi:phosphonate transport system permease protein
MSVLAMAGAGLIGLIFAFPAAFSWMMPGGILDTGGNRRLRTLMGGSFWALSRAFLLLLRAVPPFIWALIAVWLLFPGILPGAAALAAYTAGILGRLMAEVVENLDHGPARALKSQGASGLQVAAYGILPQALPRFTAYLLYRWEVCIRATVVVGLVGAGGLGQALRHQIASFDHRGMMATLMAFVLLTIFVDFFSARARRALR